MAKIKLDFDLLHQVEYPQVILCRRSYEKIGELIGVEDLTIECPLVSYGTISFSFPYKYSDRINPLWDKIKDLSTIFIPHFGYYLIKVSERDDGQNKTKQVTGQTMEVELGQILLHGVQINVTDGDVLDDDYKPKKFYDNLNPSCSILHILLKEAPHWKIGHVDESLMDKQRTFDIDGASIYDTLTGDVAKEFNCIFIFDSFTRTVHAYDSDTFGDETTLFMSHENYIDNFTVEANADEIKNCFKVSGGDGIDIREVNPNGTQYIYAWSDQDLEDMTEELSSKLAGYTELYDSKKDSYESIMIDINKKIDEILELQSKAPTDNTTEDWSKYSLAYLREKLKSQQNLIDVYINNGWGDVGNENYKTYYLPTHNKIVAIEAEIKVRESQIEAKYAEYHALCEQKNAIQDSLNIEKYLGEKLWLELSSYRREQTYDNSNYSVTDETTDIERFQMTKQLYDTAYEELQKINEPIYQFSTSMANIYAIFDAQKSVVDKFQLGNYIRVGNMEDDIHKVRFIKAKLNFSDLGNISVEFSEMMESSGIESTKKGFWDDVRQAATSYSFIRKQYNKDKDAMSYVKSVRLAGLSSALADVQNADDQDFTIGSRGVIGKLWNEDKGDYEPEQIHIINNKIVFTDDAWKSCKMAIGKVNINGTDAYGIIADVLVGKMIIGEQMYIGNSANTLVFDTDGLKVTNGINTFTVSPNSDDSIIDISNSSGKVMYADAKGNLTLTASIFTKSGTIGGWTIDEDGISGNGIINGGAVVGAAISGGSVYGATITSTDTVSGTTTIDGGAITSVSADKNKKILIHNGSFESNETGGGTSFIKGGTFIQNGAGSLIQNTGADSFIRNSSSFTGYDESGNQIARTGLVSLQDGTILVKGSHNAFLRGMVGTAGYYKLIGLSSQKEIVIGQSTTSTNAYFGSELYNATGKFTASTPVKIFCTKLTINRNGTDYTAVDTGNFGSQTLASTNVTLVSTQAGVGNYQFGGAVLTGAEYVQSTFARKSALDKTDENVGKLQDRMTTAEGNITSINQQIKALQQQIAALQQS